MLLFHIFSLRFFSRRRCTFFIHTFCLHTRNGPPFCLYRYTNRNRHMYTVYTIISIANFLFGSFIFFFLFNSGSIYLSLSLAPVIFVFCCIFMCVSLRPINNTQNFFDFFQRLFCAFRNTSTEYTRVENKYLIIQRISCCCCFFYLFVAFIFTSLSI